MLHLLKSLLCSRLFCFENTCCACSPKLGLFDTVRICYLWTWKAVLGTRRHRIRFVIMSDGERIPMLIDETGLPHWYATLLVTSQVRNASKAPNTVLAILHAIRILSMWAESLDVSNRAQC